MMFDLEFIWQGNSLRDWSTALGLALSINLFVGVLKWLIEHRLAKVTRRSLSVMDDVVVAMARHTKQLLVFGVTLLAGTRYLDLPAGLDHVLIKVATIAGFLQLGLWLSGALNFWIEHYRRFWEASLDRLDDYLKRLQSSEAAPKKPPAKKPVPKEKPRGRT